MVSCVSVRKRCVAVRGVFRVYLASLHPVGFSVSWYERLGSVVARHVKFSVPEVLCRRFRLLTRSFVFEFVLFLLGREIAVHVSIFDDGDILKVSSHELLRAHEAALVIVLVAQRPYDLCLRIAALQLRSSSVNYRSQIQLGWHN